MYRPVSRLAPAFAPAFAPALGQVPTAPAAATGELAATMIVRGAVGTLIGAAVATPGNEGAWGALGFAVGAAFGEVGIVGIALAALWRKAT